MPISDRVEKSLERLDYTINRLDDGVLSSERLNSLKKGEDISNAEPDIVLEYMISLSPSDRISFINKNLKYFKENLTNILDMCLDSSINVLKGISYDDIKYLKVIDKDLFKEIISSEVLLDTLKYDEAFKLLISEEAFFKEQNADLLYVYLDNLSSRRMGTSRSLPKMISNIYYLYSDKLKELDDMSRIDLYRIIEETDTYFDYLIENKDIFDELILDRDYIGMNRLFNRIDKDKLKTIVYCYLDGINKLDFHRIFEGVDGDDLDYVFSYKDLLKDSNITNIISLYYKSDKFLDYLKSRSCEIDHYDIYRARNTKCVTWDKINTVSDLITRDLNLNSDLEEYDISDSLFGNKFIRNIERLKHNKDLDDTSTHEFFMSFIDKRIRYNYTYMDEYEVLYNLIKSGKVKVQDVMDIGYYNNLIMFNRLRFNNFRGTRFSKDQVKNMNSKKLKDLLSTYGEFNNSAFIGSSVYNDLIMKSYLLFGYNNAKKFLDKCDKMTLNQLISDIYTKDIDIDSNKEPVTNKKLNNLLFSDSKVMDELFKDKHNDLYRYFPRLFSDWKGLDYYNKQSLSLSKCIDLLKNSDIILPPGYDGLPEELTYIGLDEDRVEKAMELYDEIVMRDESTIPRVEGRANGYDYEILDINDFKQMSVGSRTKCCFEINGVAYESLKHACTNKNGRVFTISKEGNLYAHSWVWRNGTYLCFDNIEVSKNIKKYDFLECYKKASKEIAKKSKEHENKPINTITVGVTSFDAHIEGIRDLDYFCTTHSSYHKGSKGNKTLMDELVQPKVDNYVYTDSKNVQAILYKKGNYELYDCNKNYTNIDKPKVKKLNFDFD